MAVRRLVAAIAIAVGAALFALGENLHGSSREDLGAVLVVGLADGSIWLLLGGAFVASFGVALWLDTPIRRA